MPETFSESTVRKQNTIYISLQLLCKPLSKLWLFNKSPIDSYFFKCHTASASELFAQRAHLPALPTLFLELHDLSRSLWQGITTNHARLRVITRVKAWINSSISRWHWVIMIRIVIVGWGLLSIKMLCTCFINNILCISDHK